MIATEVLEQRPESPAPPGAPGQLGFEALPVPLYVATAAGSVLAANSAFVRLLGGSAGTDGTGVDLAALHVSASDWQRLRSRLAMRPGARRVEAELRRLDGRLIRVENRAWALPVGAGGETLVAGALYDITRQRRREARYLRRALHDPLTSLPNRALLLERVRQALAKQRRPRGGAFSLLFIDLDGFKSINDALGHLAGDALLRAVARRLRACVRPHDTVARFSGDEFCVLVDAAPEVALRVAERVRRAVAAPFAIGPAETLVRVSIGLATAPLSCRTAEEVLQRADEAMYRAKAAGGDRIAFADCAGAEWEGGAA